MKILKCVKCHLCDSGIDKVAVGLNKKLLGRQIERFFCLDCLSAYLDISVDELLAKAEEFKAQGCALFE